MTALITNTAEFDNAIEQNLDAWVPGCGGHETEFVSRRGFRLLWCYNPAQQKHAYVNLDTDIVLTNDEANAAMWG
ncbi:MAG: hypothetical protein JRD89_01995 [Deltaproteobacteria bacterium]|nr:hypothetical protein [Deltaproteobacteria bacterium]